MAAVSKRCAGCGHYFVDAITGVILPAIWFAIARLGGAWRDADMRC